MRPVRLLSFNIHGGRGLDRRRDLARIGALLDSLDIDIGVFQEVETRPSRRAAAADMAVLAGQGRPHELCGPCLVEDAGWYGNLLVSRYPIVRGLVHNLDTRPELEPRGAVDALVDTPIGRLRVIGTHLSLRHRERKREAENLIRLVHDVEAQATEPVVLMGDINEWRRRSRLLRYLDGVMTPLPCRPTFPSLLPIFALDRVWHDAPDLEVRAERLAAPGLRRLSDHLPVLVEVRRAETARREPVGSDPRGSSQCRPEEP